jgi:putative transposase
LGEQRSQARVRYAAFVDAGSAEPSVWEGLRSQIFLGSQAFAERFAGAARKPEALREVPRAQRRPLAKPLADFERDYLRREAMARAFLTGVYTMQEIADHFHVHYATVSRAVRWLQGLEKRSGEEGRTVS